MCRTFGMMFENDMPLVDFVRAVRRYFIIDLIIGILYGALAISYGSSPSIPTLCSLAALLTFLYFVCAAGLLYVTGPDRIMHVTANQFHGHTALNVVTLVVNIVYSISSKVLLHKSGVAYFVLSLIVCLLKVSRVYVIHRMAMRVITEGPSSFVRMSNGILDGMV